MHAIFIHCPLTSILLPSVVWVTLKQFVFVYGSFQNNYCWIFRDAGKQHQHPTHNSDLNPLDTFSGSKGLGKYINSFKLILAFQSRPGLNMRVPIRVVISVALILVTSIWER